MQLPVLLHLVLFQRLITGLMFKVILGFGLYRRIIHEVFYIFLTAVEKSFANVIGCWFNW